VKTKPYVAPDAASRPGARMTDVRSNGAMPELTVPSRRDLPSAVDAAKQ